MRRIRSLVATVAAALLATGLTVGTESTASAVVPVTPPTGLHELFLQILRDADNAPQCLDVTDGSTSPGKILQIFHCHGFAPNGAPQLFRFLGPTSAGKYQIVTFSGLCVTPNPATGIVGGSLVVQQKCAGPGHGQEWSFQSVGSNGEFEVVNGDSGGALCLSARVGSSIVDHDQTSLIRCNTVPDHQIWLFG
jgi:hypothetical protein